MRIIARVVLVIFLLGVALGLWLGLHAAPVLPAAAGAVGIILLHDAAGA